MPVSKVDSRCFNLSQRIDEFLSLSNSNRTDLTPPDFWKELVQSEEAVSSYIVCLIAKLIALDSEHGLRPLPHVYKDLVEMPVDHTKYKQWSSKPLPANCKSAALELQYAIITTIRHMKDCYGYAPNIHLRHMYLRWNLARNYLGDGGRKADEFEEKVIAPFSVAQAKEIIHSPVGSPLRKSMSSPAGHATSPSPLSTEEEELVLVRRLVDECYTSHRRAFFGGLPPEQCKLCSYTNATDCLSYIRLRDLTSRSPRLLHTAMSHVLSILSGDVSHSHTYGEKEVLLPLLHLFREFLTMMCPVDTVEVYRCIMPFYMWPLSHSEYTRGVLDQILQEGRVRGVTFRQQLLAEQDVGLKPSETKVRGHLVHMLIDTSHPLTRGGLLHELFTAHQEKQEPHMMHRLIIRNVLKSLDPDHDIIELEGKLVHLSSDALKNFCLKSLEMAERLSSSGDSSKTLRTEAEKLRKDIIEHVESDEQRDSAVSCTSVDSDSLLSEDRLNSFPLPRPYIQQHSLNDTQYPTVLNKLRELLIMCRQRLPPLEPRREGSTVSLQEAARVDIKVTAMKKMALASVSSSSQTSLDSTGSSSVTEQDRRINPDPILSGSDSESKKSLNGVIANGHASHISNDVIANGGHVTADSDHMINGTNQNSALSINVTDSDPSTRKRPISLQGIEQPAENDSTRNTLDTPKSHDRMSLTSEDRISDSGSVSPASLRRHNNGSPRELIRRQTCPSGMYNPKRTSMVNATSPSNSRRYVKTSVHSKGPRTNSLQNRTLSVSGKVKIRRNPSAVTRSSGKRCSNSRKSLNATSSPSTKLVKVLLAGNDNLVSHVAKAYAHLRMDEPNLLSGMELRFYHIPLSRASLIHSQFPELARASLLGVPGQGGQGSVGGAGGGTQDLPEPMFEQIDMSGNDVHIGRFLAHMDSWYERNVMMAVHHLLRLIPSDLQPSNASSPAPAVNQRPMSPISPTFSVGEATLASRTNLTPSRVLLEAVSNYTREARNCIQVNMYKLKMNIKNEKSHKMDYREMYMLHRLDIQRLSGKKTANRQVKTFEANVTMTQLSLDGGLVRSDMMEMKDVWVMRASNVPRAESDCFELSIIKAQAEGGRLKATKFRVAEEMQYHVCDLIIETRDKPFTVMVDSDTDVLLDNVIRLEVQPAYMEQSSSTAKHTEQKTEKKLQFPLMTYWPVDL